MAKQSPSEQLDQIVAALLGPADAPLRPDATSPQFEPGWGSTIEVIRGLQSLPGSHFRARLKADLERRATMTVSAKEMKGTGEQAKEAVRFREGFHSITPYLIITGAGQWIEFAKQAFHAEERLRVQRPGTENVIMHAEVRIGDSMIELADANQQFPAMPSALWLRVNDVDAAYRRALEAGATMMHAPSDQEYGSRDGSVKDLSGNHWYIYTPKPDNTVFKELRSVTPYLHPLRGALLIEFLEKAFGAEEMYRAQSPDGVIHHAQVRIGDSVIGMGDAHGIYQPMPSTLHLYVSDADATYEQALRAGASSIQPPANQPYGERNAGVTDPFGNRWFIATPIPQ
jgi:PhnB protein